MNQKMHPALLAFTGIYPVGGVLVHEIFGIADSPHRYRGAVPEEYPVIAFDRCGTLC
jgi:hypothetical protein